MVRDEVEDHLEHAGAGFRDQPVEIRERAENGGDVTMVRNVVAEIRHR